MSLMPDPTFYPSPRMAMKAQPERLAYVALLNVGNHGKKDAMGVIGLDPSSSEYGQLIGQVDFPRGDSELGVLAVGDGSPAGGERSFDNFRREDFFELFCRKNVERAAERLIGIEGHSSAWRNIDANGLRGGNASGQKKRGEEIYAAKQQLHESLPKGPIVTI